MKDELIAIALWDILPFETCEPARELAMQCVDDYKLKRFIETGTFKGGTSKWVICALPGLKIDTVEYSWPLYLFASLRLLPWRLKGHVLTHHGDSGKLMHSIADDSPTLFWLDAHSNTGGPLAEELRTIKNQVHKAVIMIDDFSVGPNVQGIDLKCLQDNLPADDRIFMCKDIRWIDKQMVARHIAVVFHGLVPPCLDGRFYERFSELVSKD